MKTLLFFFFSYGQWLLNEYCLAVPITRESRAPLGSCMVLKYSHSPNLKLLETRCFWVLSVITKIIQCIYLVLYNTFCVAKGNTFNKQYFLNKYNV